VPLGQTKRSSLDSEWIRTSYIEKNHRKLPKSYRSYHIFCCTQLKKMMHANIATGKTNQHSSSNSSPLRLLGCEVSLAKVLSSLRCRRGTTIESWALVEWGGLNIDGPPYFPQLHQFEDFHGFSIWFSTRSIQYQMFVLGMLSPGSVWQWSWSSMSSLRLKHCRSVWRVWIWTWNTMIYPRFTQDLLFRGINMD